MCSRSPIPDRTQQLAFALGAACVIVLGAGASRAQSPARTPAPTAAEEPLSVPVTKLFPDSTKPPQEDPTAKQYLDNAQEIAKGAQLFNWMNCSGCHFHGAGGMGPPFMNGGHFIYGGRLDQIYASIYQGRPNGMPSWGQKLSRQQIWQLAAYVKALSQPSEAKLTGGPPMPETPPPAAATQPTQGRP